MSARVGRLLRSACHARLAYRLSDWSADGHSAAVYSTTRLSVCRVVLQIPRARHARLVAAILARTSRGCYEQTASVEFKLLQACRLTPRSIQLTIADVDVSPTQVLGVSRRVADVRTRCAQLCRAVVVSVWITLDVRRPVR